MVKKKNDFILKKYSIKLPEPRYEMLLANRSLRRLWEKQALFYLPHDCTHKKIR